MKLWLTLASATILACSLGTAAKAAVSWDFIITAAINTLCPECPATVPTRGGSLTVSDEAFLRGSLFYSYYVEDPPFPDSDSELPRAVVTGDNNFSLAMGIDILLPINPSVIGWNNFGDVGSIDLSFSLEGGISGSIFEKNQFADISMIIADGAVTQARWGSDWFVPGCAPHVQCIIDGYWQLTTPLPIPEPPSVGILAGAVAMLGLLKRQTTTRRRARRLLCE